jgi:hypothetical protein
MVRIDIDDRVRLYLLSLRFKRRVGEDAFSRLVGFVEKVFPYGLAVAEVCGRASVSVRLRTVSWLTGI